jgi:hypothetical protein
MNGLLSIVDARKAYLGFFRRGRTIERRLYGTVSAEIQQKIAKSWNYFPPLAAWRSQQDSRGNRMHSASAKPQAEIC